jgi:hypothetical protein
MSKTREVKESPIYQGSDEIIAYTLTTTPWGSSPSSPTVVIKSLPDLSDTSVTNLNGAPSVLGDVITTPAVKSLTAGTRYRLEIKFTISGNVFETYCIIIAEP